MNRTLTFGLSRSFGGTWNGFAKPQRLPIHQATIRKNQGLHVTPVPRVLKTSRFSPYRDLDFLAGSRGKDWRERTAGQDPISRNALSHKTVISHFEEPKVQTILRHTKNHMKGLEEKRPRVFNGNNVSKLFLRHEATWGPKIVGVARSQPRSSAPPVPCDTVAHPAAEPLREHCCALGGRDELLAVPLVTVEGGNSAPASGRSYGDGLHSAAAGVGLCSCLLGVLGPPHSQGENLTQNDQSYNTKHF